MKQMLALIGVVMFGFVALVAQAVVYTVQTDEVLSITDATVGDYAGGIAFKDATGVVTFDTTSAPTMDITGAGTVKKISTATWVLSKHIPNFTGAYELTAGTTIFCPPKSSGCDYLGNVNSGGIYVREGADLHLLAYNGEGGAADAKNYPLNIKLWSKPVHIAGSGPDGMGALVSTNKCQYTDNAFLLKLFLDDDATWGLKNSAYFYMGSIDLGGHNLTLQGRGDVYISHNGTLKGEGDVILQPDAAKGKPSLNFRTCNVEASETSGIRMRGGSITLTDASNEIDKRNRPIWVEEDGSLGFLDYWSGAAGTDLSWEKRNGWKGPIDIAKGKTLTVSSSHTTRLFVLEGEITGAGKLATGYGSKPNLLVRGNPLFSGPLHVGYNGHFTLLSPFPSNACNITYYDIINSQPIALQTYPDKVEWDWTNAVSFANASVWTDSKFPCFDDAITQGEEPAMPVELDPAVRLKKPLGAKIPMTFTPSTTSADPVNLRWHAGRATLTGGRDRMQMIGQLALSTRIGDVWLGGLVVSNVTVATTETNRYEIGCGSSYLGRLAIADATWSVMDPFNRTSFAAVGIGGFRVGAGGVGELRIGKGAVVTNLFTVGGGGDTVMSSGSSGQGAVVQNGGEVYVLGTTTAHETSSIGAANGIGYYELNGGRLETHKQFQVGGYAFGNFVMNGGEARWNSSLLVGAGNGGSGHCRVKGGTLDVNGSVTLRATYQGDYSFGILSAEGATAKVKATSVYANGNFASVGDTHRLIPHPVSYASFREGATLEANGIGCKYGTLDVGFDNATFIVGNVDVFQNGNASPARPTVYKGGLTIQAEGGNAYTYQPIRGATGKGVKSVTLPAITGTLVAAPVIHLVGDGYGAVAACEFDSTAHKVTGVKILSSGCNYNCVTALVYYAEGAQGVSASANALPKLRLTSTAGEIALEENENTGTFTKTGAGNFHLYATNTWGGATVVTGGRLYLDSDWSLPKGTDLKVGGGAVVDFGNKTNEIASFTYLPGGCGGRWNRTQVALPSTFGLEISAEDIAADRPILFTSNQNFADVDGFTLTGDVSALDYEAHPELLGAKHYIIRMEDGELYGTFDPAWVSAITTAYPKWQVRQNPKGVYLTVPRGMTVIVR